MSVTNIGNLISQQSMLALLRNELNENQRMSTTGKRTSTIAGFGNYAASSSVSYRNKMNLTDSYTGNLNTAKTRLTIMDKSLGSITDTARDVLSQLRSQLQDTAPNATILADNAKAQLRIVTDRLNTQVDGRYVFSGTNTNDAAFTNMSGLLANVGTVVTAAITDPTTTTASVKASTGAISNTALGISTAAVTGGPVSFRADDTTDVSYSLKSSDNGFQDILRGMAIVASLPQPTTQAEQDNYWAMVNAAIDLIDSGTKAVDTAQGKLGGQARIVDDLLVQHSESKSVYEIYIGDVEDVDMAEAATKFANLKTQLETSYSIISTMKDMSLINYL